MVQSIPYILSRQRLPHSNPVVKHDRCNECHCFHSCIRPYLKLSFVNSNLAFVFCFLWPLVIEVSDQTGEKPAGECVQFKLGAHCQLVKLINECTHSFMTAESTLAHLVVTHVMYCV